MQGIITGVGLSGAVGLAIGGIVAFANAAPDLGLALWAGSGLSTVVGLCAVREM